MKILYLSIIVVLSISLLLIQFKPIQADNASDILIQNIQVQPTIVKIGDVFTVNATLVNNSSNTVSVEHGACEAPFSVTFDNHVHVSENKLNCTTQMILQRLDPSEKIIATSPYLNFIYKAVGNGNSSAVATFSYLKWDPATQSNSEKTISKPFSLTIYGNNANIQIPNHGGPPFTFQKLSPLKQFKSGIVANDVKCQQDLQLVIKTEDGSPACVKPDTAIVLVGHRWATNVPQPNPMAGLNNGTGIATLGNQAYYFETANYTGDAYHHPIQISFHDVIFTLFPSGFRGGLPAWGCGGSYYWTDSKFSDGTSELLQIFVGDQQCFVPQPSTHFSIHKNPQAGLTFYDGRMKLLVSVDNQASQNPFMADKDGKVDLSQIHLPPNNYGQIDYDKIGYLVSEDKFKKMLEQLDIKYADNNFLLLTGESLLSYPPFTGYCGYVMDNNKEEHWFSSSFHRDTLTSYKISRYNPEPCKPGFASCFCNLQTKIAENNLKQLSYFSKSEEEMVGDAVVQYLDKIKVVNVSNDFSVGKYNLQADPSLVHYCGKFTWGEQLQYFEGYMKDSNVVFFELAPEQQKLCAINADAKIFSFEYKDNGTGK